MSANLLSLHSVSLIVAVVAGLFGGALTLLAWRDPRRGSPRCPRCGYDMVLGAGLRCAECGAVARDAAQLLRPRRRRGRASLGAALAGAGLVQFLVLFGWERGWHYVFLPTWRVTERHAVGPVDVRVEEIRNPQAATWRRRVALEGPETAPILIEGFAFTIGGVERRGAAFTTGQLLDCDLTGDGLGDLVITVNSMGTDGAGSTHLFGLHPALHPIAELPWAGAFENLDADPAFEFVVNDNSFRHRWTSGADSPLGEVVFRWRRNPVGGGSYEPAPELMRTPALSDASLDQLLVKESKRRRTTQSPVSGGPGTDITHPDAHASGSSAQVDGVVLLHQVIRLVYTGHADAAERMVRRHWQLLAPVVRPKRKGGPATDALGLGGAADLLADLERTAFELELRSALLDSPFAGAIRGVNADQEYFGAPT